MIGTGRQGPRSPASVGLNLKKWVKIGLLFRKNSQFLEMLSWGTLTREHVMFPLLLPGRRLLNPGVLSMK